MSHTITITRLPDENNDDAEYEVGGTCTSQCTVWFECNRKACSAMNPDYGQDERTRHGVLHMHIPGVGWCTESNQCGAQYAYELGLEAERATSTGVYPLSIEWNGDGWDAFIDFDARTPIPAPRYREERAMAEPEGVWCVCDIDHRESITEVYPTEVEALRAINGRGYGRVRFVPFGKSLVDLAIGEKRAGGES